MLRTSLNADYLASQATAIREAIIDSLTPEQTQVLLYDWEFWARAKQLPPPGDWETWLIMAGRGWGKTRTGAEWIRYRVEKCGARRVALVARTAADARDVMVEGESGILAISPPWFRPEYEPSKRRLTWPNGAIATTYSGDKPDQLRGPQHDTAWCDELASWRYAESWDQLLFGLRLGDDPRALVTTTPRPTPIMKELSKDVRTALTSGSTFENTANLPERTLNSFRRRYEGTRLGRQELYAELLTDTPGALWTYALIEKYRIKVHEEKEVQEEIGRIIDSLTRIVVAIDPATTSHDESNETGIVVVGKDDNGRGYVLEDLSLRGTPDQWGRVAVDAYYRWKADRIVAEVNNGGEMVKHVIHTIDQTVSYKSVQASRGTAKRAEPISALYEQGKISHIGMFSVMEDQMCTYRPDLPKSAQTSPDRMDALVWGFTELMISGVGQLQRSPNPFYG